MARFTIEDREYVWDGAFTTEEALLFFDKANLGMAQVDAELERWNPYAIVTFMYILKKRAGESVLWHDLLHLPVRAFAPVPEEPAAEPGAEGSEGSGEATDPTEGSGTTPGSDTTNT